MSGRPTADTVEGHPMNPVKIILGFIPFLLFSVLAHWLATGWSALIAFAAALILIALTARGGLKILPVVQAVIMGVIALVAAVGGSGVDDFLRLNARGGASLLLGAFIVATASVAPFTADFAKQEVPQQYWSTPGFRAINRKLSTVWGVTVLVVGICHIVSAHLDAAGTRPIVVVLIEWVLPILALLRAVKVTRDVAAHRPADATGSPV
ncbi:MAG TPA: hypothetical protein DIW80_10610 [Gordonia polyisoprenivorans]|uniref:hypothetical protein n=2 Tax=Gordonia polyisoprenivorans TaxID=84595 RepID=UPI000B99D600|nr:hypothetical protein [Gordonia polyisoprenivorans]MBE7194418.1 hypothetical protein [Gordonia polyisoprenivorans]HCS57604.1 hypothetical protein [Gordonia polyisoprenivorans]